ncbi:hypothetical protein IJE86_08020 [bacterium]|nr:hypothetical protein [bacterium]
MSKTIENLKNGNYEVVDNQGVSVTRNFVECLEKEFADLEAKLAESEKKNRELHTAINLSIPNQIAMKDEIDRLHTCVDKRIGELVEENTELKQQLAEKQKEKIEYTDTINFVETSEPDIVANELDRLNQQLIYKEKELNDWKDGTIICKWTDAENKVKDLEHQLAEKEEQLNSAQVGEQFALKCCKEAEEQLEKQAKIHYKHLKEKDQDKISFCVKHLTEIREYVKECQSLDTTEGKVRLDIAKKIRLKIEELKKEMK